MPQLPIPSEAYWVGVPWWGYFGFFLLALIVVFILGPWVVQRSRHRPSAILSREEALVAREAKLVVQRDTYLEDLKNERARIVRKMQVAEEDRDQGWDLGRGMEIVAHDLWHAGNDARQKFNNMLILVKRVIDGTLRVDTASEIVKDYSALDHLPRPPRLEDVARKKPHESKYVKPDSRPNSE